MDHDDTPQDEAPAELLLPGVLQDLIAQSGLSFRQLADQCEISPSTITELTSRARRCKPAILALLISKLTDCEKLKGDRLARYRLLFAHLYDEIKRTGEDTKNVSINHIDSIEPQKLLDAVAKNADIGILISRMDTDPALARIVSDLATMIVEKEAQLADRSATVVPFTAPSPAPAKVAESPGAYPGPASADQLISNSRARRTQASLASSKSSASSSS